MFFHFHATLLYDCSFPPPCNWKCLPQCAREPESQMDALSPLCHSTKCFPESTKGGEVWLQRSRVSMAEFEFTLLIPEFESKRWKSRGYLILVLWITKVRTEWILSSEFGSSLEFISTGLQHSYHMEKKWVTNVWLGYIFFFFFTFVPSPANCPFSPGI